MSNWKSIAGLVTAIVVMSTGGGCQSVEPAVAQPRSERAKGFDLDVTPILRGTVASEAVMRGADNVIVRGWGLVYGLRGTGSGEMSPEVRAHLVTELSRRGIGSAQRGTDHINPDAWLSSDTTAVVIVEAVIPPAAVKGSTIDVRVVADPAGGASSLEGGILWHTELRPGPLVVGRGESSPMARASGPVFINPFAEPGAVGRDSIDRRQGRVLKGGEVLKDTPIKLYLATPSHARAAIMQSSINGRFPREPRQASNTARAETDGLIEIHVPPSFRDSTQRFIELLMHGNIRMSNTESIALSVKRALLADPSIADTASLRWEAMGNRVLPIIKELYDYPEELPRMAALKAGARLDDALVIPRLIDMAKLSESTERRKDAIELLSGMRASVRINQCLQELLDDDDVDVRLEAYEGLALRGDPHIRRQLIDGKFILDVVDAQSPMIYISQRGEPRIVIFNRELQVNDYVLVTAWSNRLMIQGTAERDYIEVYFRDANRALGAPHKVGRNVADLVRFFGHMQTVDSPEPGLGLTYAETVSALYQIWRQQFLAADFKAEQDRILAQIMNTERESRTPDRPEFAADTDWDDSLSSGRGVRSGLDRLDPAVPTIHQPVVPR